MATRLLSGIILTVVLLLAAPLQSATLDDVITDFPLTFEGLTADKFTRLPAAPDVPDAYSATIDVPALGPVTAWVYDLPGSPKLAVALPRVPDALDDLTSAVGIQVSSPVVFWVKEAGTLDTHVMPAELKAYVTEKTGMPRLPRVLKGVNLFGRFASTSLLKPLNLPEACLGFAAEGKTPETKTTLVTLVIPPGSQWQNPFNLPNTTIRTGVVMIKSSGGSTPRTDVESWATAALTGAAHDFTMYAKHDGTRLTGVGFDTASASLKDFFAVLGAFGTSLSLPELPTPPEKAVKLANDNVQTYRQNERPEFSKMMFQAMLTGDGNDRVSVNARGEVFDVSVAEVELQASAKGIYLSLPSACPLRPIGLTADLTKITATGIPVTAEVKDCFSGAIIEVANAAAEASAAAASAVKDAGETAATLAGEAATEVGSYTAERAEVWSKAIAQTAVAGAAVAEASNLVDGLDREITSLGKDIRDLEDEINGLLRKAWSFVTGEVNSLRSKKSRKSSQRDRKRTELAHANRVLEQARSSVAKDIGAPFAAEFVESTDKLLAATAQQQVQEALNSYAAAITGEQILEELRVLTATGKLPFIAVTEFESTELTDALRAQASLQEAVAAHAVASLIEKKREEFLRAAVANLPTMAYDVPVRIVSGRLKLQHDVVMRGVGGKISAGGGNGDRELFIFHADGTLESVFSPGLCVSRSAKRPICDASCDGDEIGRIYFDPFTGQIRLLSVGSDGKPLALCMQIPQRPETAWTECGAASSSFKLVRADADARGLRSVAAFPDAANVSSDGAETTNLDPLSLPPLEP